MVVFQFEYARGPALAPGFVPDDVGADHDDQLGRVGFRHEFPVIAKVMEAVRNRQPQQSLRQFADARLYQHRVLDDPVHRPQD